MYNYEVDAEKLFTTIHRRDRRLYQASISLEMAVLGNLKSKINVNPFSKIT